MKPQKFLVLALLASAAAAVPVSVYAQASSNVHVWVTGLNGPRGLRFGPDGNVYVAEAGTGGSTSTAGTCTQVIPPVGPYLGGNTSRVSKIDKNGNRTDVVTGLPSTVDALGDLSGAADVIFVKDTLYVLEGGAGCSHGDALPNGIYKVNHSGPPTLVADLSKFVQTHPVLYPNIPDFEPDGTFFSITELGGKLYAVEPNHGQIIAIGLDGSMRNAIDLSASQGHIVPTAAVARDGQIYVGTLGQFPIEPTFQRILTLGHSECSRVAAEGLEEDGGPHSLHVESSKAGFTTVTGVAFGPDGLLYVLEMSDAAGFPTPGAGKVVRVNRDGKIEDIATGLVVPTGITFSPEGKLYVSNFGAAPAGLGQIVQIDLP